MKNLLFVTSLGLAVFFSNGAFGQDVNEGDKPKQEKKYNPKSNSKNYPDRNFGKDRAATVQEMNGGGAQEISGKKNGKQTDKQAEKQARKEEKERLKAEKKMVKKNKLKK